jgi:hypothetical protein
MLQSLQVVTEIEALLDKQATHLKHEEQTTLRRFKNKLAQVRQGAAEGWAALHALQVS